MCKLTYEITENTITLEGKSAFSYGITVYENSNKIREIPDVSTDKKSVEELCSLCNRLKLSYDHIEDVIDDLLVK